MTAEEMGAACAASFLAPDRWLPTLAAHPAAPFTQRRAEVCAVKTLLALPTSRVQTTSSPPRAAALAAEPSSAEANSEHSAAVAVVAAVAAASPAFLALIRSAVGGGGGGVGCIGVAVVLRTGAGLLEAAWERVDAIANNDAATATVEGEEKATRAALAATGAPPAGAAATPAPAVDPRDVEALRSLAHGLAAACRAAGEKRVLRRVEATTARIFACV